MKVRLHNMYRAWFSDKKYEMIKEAITFFLDKNNLNQYNCSVDFYLDSQHLKDRSCSGLLEMHSNLRHAKVHVKSTIFTNDLLDTIFHELTHLKQHLVGDLKMEYNRDIWKGAPFPTTNFTKLKYTTYLALPWEVEARKVAKEMLILFKQSRSRKKTFWQKLKFWSI